jgi:D-amino-acid oxidase
MTQAAQPPAAVVVCVGLAARTLGGVEDKDVYPVSGQTVRLRAPWIRDGQTVGTEEGSHTYTIPRKGGDVSPLPFFFESQG